MCIPEMKRVLYVQMKSVYIPEMTICPNAKCIPEMKRAYYANAKCIPK